MSILSIIEGIESRIKAGMRSRGINHSELAGKINLSQGALSYYAASSRMYADIEKIAEELGVTADFIQYGDDIFFPVVLKKWNRLSHEKKSLIAALIAVLEKSP